MRFKNNNFATEHRSTWLRFFLLTVVATLVLVPVTLNAQVGPKTSGANAHSKLAADLANFPLNSDGTVDVIVQFKQTPKAHASEMAAQGGRLRFSFEHINGAAYRIPVRMLAWLEMHPDVAYVSPDRPNKVASDDDIPAVEGDVARQQYGVDGTGIGVAIIDSGVFNHDDLQKSGGLGSRIVYSESFIPGDTSTNDAYGHGTHVAGIVAGNGHDSASGYPTQYIGVAPNANIINLRVLDANGSGTDSVVIAAIQRAIQLKSTYNIRVINLSLGRPVFESYTVDPLCQAVEAAWKAGIVVVVAAGNQGRNNSAGTNGYGTITAPGNDPYVITVGAMKTMGTTDRSDDLIASYSSKGPTLFDHYVKPDILAPGNRIVSTLPSGMALSSNYPNNVVDAEFFQLSGTSMAAPVVSG